MTTRTPRRAAAALPAPDPHHAAIAAHHAAVGAAFDRLRAARTEADAAWARAMNAAAEAFDVAFAQAGRDYERTAHGPAQDVA